MTASSTTPCPESTLVALVALDGFLVSFDYVVVNGSVEIRGVEFLNRKESFETLRWISDERVRIEEAILASFNGENDDALNAYDRWMNGLTGMPMSF